MTKTSTSPRVPNIPSIPRITIETVAELVSKQSVMPAWMARIIRGMEDDDLVKVTRSHSPAGSHVIHVHPVSDSEV